jgi:hypothetical protein
LRLLVAAGACSLDVPLAPKLLGQLVGLAVAEGLLGLEALPELCKPIEPAEPRRALAAAALHWLKVRAPRCRRGVRRLHGSADACQKGWILRRCFTGGVAAAGESGLKWGWGATAAKGSFSALVWCAWQAKDGEDKLRQRAVDAKIKASEFLELDTELDPPDLPSAEAFLKQEGLSFIPA